MVSFSHFKVTKTFMSVTFILVTGCRPHNVNFYSLENRGGIFYSTVTDRPYNGDCTDNGKYEGHMVHGKRVGIWKEYMHPSMRVFIEYDSFSDGVLNGVKRIYSPAGHISATVEYRNGVRHGDSTRYDTIGNPTVIIELQNGQESGRYISFYPSGQRKEVGQLLNGYRDGRWTFYSDRGNEVSTVNYRQGFVDSILELMEADSMSR